MYVNNLHLYKACACVTENSLKTPPPQTQAAVKRAVGVCKQVPSPIHSKEDVTW